MNDTDPLITAYYRLGPTQYTVLQSFTITQGVSRSGVCEQSLSLVLSKDIDSKGPNLYLSFRGVRNLAIQQPEWSQISIGHLEILAGESIPQINCKYLVRDPEPERIVWFECDDFDAILSCSQ